MKKFLLFTGVFAMAAMLGGCGKTPVPDTPDPDPDDPDVPSALYEVGDYYEKGFLKGIVFNVDETGEHGYILALDETVAVWSYKDENVMYGTPATNGDYNCALVREMENWQENYPGFYWADSKNVLGLNNWYVPSSQEMAMIYTAYTGHAPEAGDDEGVLETAAADADASSGKAWFNGCLTSHGGVAIDDVLYWTSGEYGPQIAYVFDMSTGTNCLEQEKFDKTNEYPFRAISRF